ncbi:MAG: Activator of Hsp90 ATPase 1 family protein [Candidatus Solibacter sp.]|jgi:uncharacterized protein YndB with AHSA1/START domain|nr:Activator of Hsp90 ATPase 1 family protein [Candidatus Solibacter sp.]
MKEPSAIHATFVMERKYKAAPEKVFAAFADPAKKRRWFVESGGHELIEQYQMDFRVGGQERACFRFKEGTPVAGLICVTEGRYQDIVPDRRIVEASTMTIGGRRISASQVTIDLLPDEGGTELILTHQGAFFEGADGPQMREGGWRKLIDRLEGELEA